MSSTIVPQPNHPTHNTAILRVSSGNSENEKDLRYLYDSLRTFSTFMPQQLVAVSADDDGENGTRRSSWRRSNVLEEYRTVKWEPPKTASVTWKSDHFERNVNSIATKAPSSPSPSPTTTAAAIEMELDGSENSDQHSQQSTRQATHQIDMSSTPAEEVCKQGTSEGQEEANRNSLMQASFQAASAISPETSSEASSEASSETETTEDFDDIIKDLQTQLVAAIRGYRTNLSIQLFETATIQHKVDLELSVVLELFQLLSNKHPFHCYQVMHYILKQSGCALVVPGKDRYIIIPSDQQQQQQDELQSAGLSSDDHDGIQADEISSTSNLEHADVELVGQLYERMCSSLRSLNPRHYKLGEIRSLTSVVLSELKQLHPVVHRRCLPVLVDSLLIQRVSTIGAWAGPLYQQMANLEYDLPPVYFQQLLIHSSFIRSSDIPYYDALRQTVNGGLRPVPHIVMNVIENMFPYTENIRGSFIALECVMELQQESLRLQMEQNEEISIIWQQLKEDDCTAEIRQQLEVRLERIRPEQSYIFDISTIECMALAASRKNHVAMMLLLWDALDLMNHKPTESMYESTILCFVQNINLIENSFVVLKDMEDTGIVPAQALVKGAALALRYAVLSLGLKILI